MSQDRVDPRVRRTRELLVKAFGELLAEKNFDTVTVNDIAGRATVNRATFYAHFRDKYEILDQAMHEWFARRLQERLPPGAILDEAGIRGLVLAVCGFLTDTSSTCRRIEGQFEPLVESQIKQVLCETLLGWLRADAADEAGHELRATVAAWSVYGAALQWSRRNNRPPAHNFADDLLPLVMPMLRAVAGTNAG